MGLAHYPETVEDLMKVLATYPPGTMVRSMRYNTWTSERELMQLRVETLFTDQTGTLDLTDKEREFDIETLILS